jgi:RNA polymerase sigma-70 factor (ECF subfamily)
MEETSRQGELERERSLFDRARASDERAFESLFEMHTPFLLEWIHREVPSSLDRKVSVTDLLQEVRIAAFQRIPDFEWRGDGALRGWLLRIAQNRVRLAIRRYFQTAKRGDGGEVSRPGRPNTAAFAGTGPSPSEAAVVAERARILRENLARLPEDYRHVLELSFQEQLTLREVGERMGRTREAVKKLHRRALTKLAEIMRAELTDGE